MALYDGFFDARYDEEADTYDRAYGVDDFTTYFGQIVGSGVCVYRNEDSFKVRIEDGNAIINPGYLFIESHWLKNDADYIVELSGEVSQAIVAHLNANEKRIDLEACSLAQSYPDSLVLALVDAKSETVEDTRYNADICGIIDAAGNVSSQITYCLQYIDTQIQTKLDQVEADIKAQAAKLDKAITNVSAEVDKIIPPSIGSIKYSLAPDVGDEWLKCDGRYITEEKYPELVALLRETGLSAQINEVPVSGLYNKSITSLGVHSGALWFSSDGKLIGVKPDGSILEIQVTGTIGKMVDVDGGVRLISVTHEISSQAEYGNGTKWRVTGITVTITSSETFDPLQTSSITTSRKSYNLDPTTYLGEYIYSIGDHKDQYFQYGNTTAYLANEVTSTGGKIWGKLLYFMACTESSWTTDTSGGLSFRKARVYLILFSLDNNDQINFKLILAGENNSSYNIENKALRASLAQYEWCSSFKNIPDKILYLSNKDYTFGVYSFDGTEEALLSANNTFPTKLGTSGGSILGARENHVLVYFSASSTDVTNRVIDLDTGLLVETVTPCPMPRTNFDNLLSPYLSNQDVWICFGEENLLFLRDLTSPEQYSTQAVKDLWGNNVKSSSPSLQYLEYDWEDTVYFGFLTSTYKILCFSMKIPTPFEPFTGANLPVISVDGIPTYIKAKNEEEDQ